MTTDLESLARRAVACPRLRWMPGMRWVTPDESESGRCDDWQPEGMARPHGALPDLTDPATVGCLLALVREAWGDPYLFVRYIKAEQRYCVCSAPLGGKPILVNRRYMWGETEAESLIKLLEAAP